MPVVTLIRPYRNHLKGEQLVVSPGKAEELLNFGFIAAPSNEIGGGVGTSSPPMETPPPQETVIPPPADVAETPKEEKKKGKKK